MAGRKAAYSAQRSNKGGRLVEAPPLHPVLAFQVVWCHLITERSRPVQLERDQCMADLSTFDLRQPAEVKLVSSTTGASHRHCDRQA
jgi:hypothetical protein